MLPNSKSIRKQTDTGEHIVQPMLIKRKIFSNGQTDNIRIISDAFQYISQFLNRHPAAAASISNQIRICKVGRVEQCRIQHINIKMNEDVVEAVRKCPDFIIRYKFLRLKCESI